MGSSILKILAAGMEIWNRWMGGYSSGEATRARQENDDQKKIDEIRKEMLEGNIDEVRRRLGSSLPPSK